jgi:hypothetical protein
MVLKFLMALAFCAAVVTVTGPVLFAQEPIREEGELSLTLEDLRVFEIEGSENLGGSLGIVAGMGRQIDASFIKSARADSRAQAERFLDLIDLKLRPRGADRAVLTILTPSDSPWEGTDYGASIDILVQVPEKARIEGELHYLQVTISGPFGGVNLDASYSALSLDGIRGSVEISTEFSPLSLNQIVGSVSAETHYAPIQASDIVVPLGSALFNTQNGAISLTNIRGPVEAYTSYSPIQANDIDASGGSVVFKTSYSPIHLQDISGELICETSYGPIIVTGAALTHGHSKIETSYSPIDAEFSGIAASQLIIYNSYNNIDLRLPSGISSQIVASIDAGGRIRTDNLPVKPTYLDVRRLEGVVGDGQNRIELKVSGVGRIDIEGQ